MWVSENIAKQMDIKSQVRLEDCTKTRSMLIKEEVNLPDLTFSENGEVQLFQVKTESIGEIQDFNIKEEEIEPSQCTTVSFCDNTSPHEGVNEEIPSTKIEPLDHLDATEELTFNDVDPCQVFLQPWEDPLIDQKVCTSVKFHSELYKIPGKICDPMLQPKTSNISEEIKRFKCKYCEKSYSENRARKIHQRSHTGKEPYKCEKCDKSYTVLSHLLAHHDSQHAEKTPFTCDYCQKSFSTKSFLYNHIKTHLGVKPHTCEKCGKSYLRKAHLRDHMHAHFNERSFHCEQCPKTYQTKTNLSTHVKNHHTKNFFSKCEECGKEFTNRSRFVTHFQIHFRKIKCICDKCGQVFPKIKGLKTHVKLAHSSKKEFQCNKCEKYLNNHLISIHSETKITNYKCNVCQKEVPDKGLIEHMKYHTGELVINEKRTNYNCNVCRREVPEKDLIEHMKYHTGELYKCDKCEKAFNNKSNLRIHQMSHE